MEEQAKPLTGRERLSYWKIGLTTMAATQELLSGLPFILFLIGQHQEIGAAIYLPVLQHYSIIYSLQSPD